MGSEERASFLRQIPQLDDGLLESAVRDEILLALGQPRSPKIAWKLRALRHECNRRRKGLYHGIRGQVLEGIREQLQRIMASPHFASRKSQRTGPARFLDFVVKRTIQGQAGDLKEPTIGSQVFGRREHYHTGEDNIVRVQAKKVRDSLAKYYKAQGRRDPIRISLPKGSYVPVLGFRSQRSKRPGNK